ncbi:MAG: peptidylprolyl isomerase [Candidatus Omnitrophica bacterium]|nr:peptidylprolyl isomerase [Candidatus Omnitrophota bacterium]
MKKSFLSLAIGLSLLISGGAVKGAEVMIEKGKMVKFDYTLTIKNEVIDTSRGKEPLEYVQGAGNIIPGLEAKMEGLTVGDERTVVVGPEDAYGVVKPEAIQEVPKEMFPADLKLAVGMMIPLQDNEGRMIQATVDSVGEQKVVLNFNHPLAGKELTFDVKIVDIK